MSGGGGAFRPGFALRLAMREIRHGLRRVGVYMASIALGVAALVAVDSFRADVARSVRREAEVLMGADARLRADVPLPAAVSRMLDSVRASGVGVARVTTSSSMVLAPSSGLVRLMQVRAMEEGYPYYGEVRTSPPGRWGAHLEDGAALVDPAVLTQLGVEVGDSLVIGRARLRIEGTVDDLPIELGYQAAIGPRVHVSHATMARAELLGFGSLARYEAFLHLPDDGEREALEDRYRDVLSEADVRFTHADEQARRIARGVRYLGRFLALVGLGALLLGGVGVASAIHVYVREKRPAVAVLRCLGAGQWTAFLAYLIQAALLGLAGAGVGVVLGVAVQALLPVALADVLLVSVDTRVSLSSALSGLAVGVWVAVIFALLPLLAVRDVPPLQALRRDFEPEPGGIDPVRVLAFALLAASVLALCIAEAPEDDVGLGFAAGLAGATAAIAAVGWCLMRLTRRFFPSGAPYPVRQGVSNLFRPQNQTISITLALGFGAFLIGTIVEVEGNVRRDLTVSFGSGRPNVLLFDVQPDQVEGVRALLPADVREGAEVSPLVTSRIEAINGRTAAQLRADTVEERRPEGWALRREYRNTYRAWLGEGETLVAGRWWDGRAGTENGARVDAGALGRVSLEEDVAESLRVGLGDTITWNVSGLEVPTVVTSLRRVDWNRLEPNFFAVLEPGLLEDAPQTLILLARMPDAERRAALQRELVGAFPNVSALDFSRVQETIDSVLSQVRRAVAFLGLFAAAAGVVVLLGALATSRVQRQREGALLKTLGARRGQVLTVLLTEYLALGTLATASGLTLSVGAAAVLLPTVFEMPYEVRPIPLAAIWLAVVAVTVASGLAGSRDLLARPPLPVLREAPE